MDLSIIANLNDVPAVQNFLEKQSIVQNVNNMSPLASAQDISNKYMSMKQRIPMVFEYYRTADSPPISVEMYINPNRLTLQTQKMKTKVVTRGGIFYHHWGDDHWTMQLSGTVGLAGMKGIQQLEKIYHYSGTLLHYTDIGVETVHDSKANFKYETIGFNPTFDDNPLDGVSYIMSNYNIPESSVQNIKQHFTDQINIPPNSPLRSNSLTLHSNTANAQIAVSILESYQNLIKMAKNLTAYSDMYTYVSNYVATNKENGRYISFDMAYQEAQRRAVKDFPNIIPEIQILIAYDVTKAVFSGVDPTKDMSYMSQSNAYNSDVINLLNKSTAGYVASSNSIQLLNNSINATHNDLGQKMADALNIFITQVQDFNKRMKINSNRIANKAWGDISDELNDEWRPRQIFIYFEDRVYIGHFDSFQYQRVAENPLINYDMRFTVTRQIIVTGSN